MIEPGRRIVDSVLLDEAEGTVREEARIAAPEEACGLLIGRIEAGRAWITRAIPCPNTAPPDRRGNRFAIDPVRLIEVERALRGSPEEVVGFYHSHPVGDPVPSAVDRTYMALWPEVLWLIVGRAEDPESASMRAWRWNPVDRAVPEEIRLSVDGAVPEGVRLKEGQRDGFRTEEAAVARASHYISNRKAKEDTIS